MHPGMPGKINVAAQEGHDVAMEAHFDGGWIKEIRLGAPELGPGEVELVRPVLSAEDAEALNEGGKANANGMPFLVNPRSDSITPVFVVASASRVAEKLPAIPEAVDGGEPAPNLSLNLCKGD